MSRGYIADAVTAAQVTVNGENRLLGYLCLATKLRSVDQIGLPSVPADVLLVDTVSACPTPQRMARIHSRRCVSMEVASDENIARPRATLKTDGSVAIGGGFRPQKTTRIGVYGGIGEHPFHNLRKRHVRSSGLRTNRCKHLSLTPLLVVGKAKSVTSNIAIATLKCADRSHSFHLQGDER